MTMGTLILGTVLVLGLCMISFCIAVYIFEDPNNKRKRKFDISDYKGKDVVILTNDPHTVNDGMSEYSSVTLDIKKLELTKDNKFVRNMEYPIHIDNILDIDVVD